MVQKGVQKGPKKAKMSSKTPKKILGIQGAGSKSVLGLKYARKGPGRGGYPPRKKG